MHQLHLFSFVLFVGVCEFAHGFEPSSETGEDCPRTVSTQESRYFWKLNSRRVDYREKNGHIFVDVPFLRLTKILGWTMRGKNGKITQEKDENGRGIITEYMVQFLNSNGNWTFINNSRTGKEVFTNMGNLAAPDTITEVSLAAPVQTVALRIIPELWDGVPYMMMTIVRCVDSNFIWQKPVLPVRFKHNSKKKNLEDQIRRNKANHRPEEVKIVSDTKVNENEQNIFKNPGGKHGHGLTASKAKSRLKQRQENPKDKQRQGFSASKTKTRLNHRHRSQRKTKSKHKGKHGITDEILENLQVEKREIRPNASPKQDKTRKHRVKAQKKTYPAISGLPKHIRKKYIKLMRKFNSLKRKEKKLKSGKKKMKANDRKVLNKEKRKNKSKAKYKHARKGSKTPGSEKSKGAKKQTTTKAKHITSKLDKLKKSFNKKQTKVKQRKKENTSQKNNKLNRNNKPYKKQRKNKQTAKIVKVKKNENRKKSKHHGKNKLRAQNVNKKENKTNEKRKHKKIHNKKQKAKINKSDKKQSKNHRKNKVTTKIAEGKKKTPQRKKGNQKKNELHKITSKIDNAVKKLKQLESFDHQTAKNESNENYAITHINKNPKDLKGKSKKKYLQKIHREDNRVATNDKYTSCLEKPGWRYANNVFKPDDVFSAYGNSSQAWRAMYGLNVQPFQFGIPSNYNDIRNKKYFLEILFPRMTHIFGFRVAGSSSKIQWGIVSKFSLYHRKKASQKWQSYTDKDDQPRVFDIGSRDIRNAHSPSVFKLEVPITARQIQLFPEKWINFPLISIDLLTCNTKDK